MNVLHINYSDVIGARFNGYCMMTENVNPDFTYSMAVWKKQSDDERVYELPPNNRIIKFVVEKLIHLTTKLGFDHFVSFFSICLLSRQNFFKEADIIHLHIIHGDTNISYRNLPKLCRKKKIVWTIHDFWAFTGGCTHPLDCDCFVNKCSKNCPHPRYNSAFKHIMPHYLFKLKNHYYKKSDFNIVVSTEKMRANIRSSFLMHSLQVNVIPFGVNINIFKNNGKEKARNQLGIPLNDFVVIFRNTGIYNDQFKGLRYAKEALLSLKSERGISVIVLEQAVGIEGLSDKFNVITTGWVDQDILITCLSASDVLLMPSLHETFGLMSIEAMACEVPVIVAEGDDTALPEVVVNGVGGIVVKSRNSDEIRNAMLLLLNDKEFHSKLCESARKRVESHFDVQTYIKRHEELYSTIRSK